MDFYVDTTPVSATFSSYSAYSSYAGSGHAPDSASLLSGSTNFLAIGDFGPNIAPRDVSATLKFPVGTSKDNSTSLLSGGVDNVASRESFNDRFVSRKDIEVSKIASDRIKLLAIKYANDSVSTEIIARLAILNSRLIEKSPRVTTEQISSLEQTIGAVKSIEQSRLERAKRLGLAV
jgi:hypothetical protein